MRGGPNIEDEGRDGHPFGVIDLWSDPGAWADALALENHSITILPEMNAEAWGPPSPPRAQITPEIIFATIEFREGRPFWRARKDRFFKNEGTRRCWNTRHAGKPVTVLIGSHGYEIIGIMQREFLLHRLLWLFEYGRWPEGQIDHIDGNPRNNALTNLRDVTPAINARNRKQGRLAASGATGVTYEADRRKWRAVVGSKNLGRFDTFEEAVAARKSAERMLGYTDRHGPILPDEPLKRPLNAAKGNGDTDAPVSAPVVSLSLHSPTDTDERPQDHV